MGRNVGLFIAGLSLVGCGMDEADFVAQYTDAQCAHIMTCSDPAVLRYDGVLTQEDCIVRHEEEVGLWGAGCKFRAGLAQECLDAMLALTCPAADGELAARPVECETIYVDCEVAPVDTDTEPAPADTDTDAA